MKYPKKLKKKTMTIEGNKYSLGDFNSYLNKKKRRARTKNANEFIKETYKQWKNDELLAYEDSKLEEKYEPFRLLMKEYKDGILLFELTDELVWSKAIKDTTGLQTYFLENSSNYMWPTRYQADIYNISSPELAEEVSTYLNEGLSQDSITKLINKDTSLNLLSTSGIYSASDQEVLTKTNLQVGISELIEHDGKYYIVHIKTVLPESPKELSETKGLVTSDYQNYLEKEWIQSLRAKYSYSLDKAVLYSIADE